MKAIVIIRTSTVRQEIESQKQEVISWAKEHGWQERDLIVIGDAGASAIKLDDLYLKNMAEIEKHILSGNIGCVFAWAIDRIGRNEEILMKFKNLLIANKVQLMTKNPSLTLLNADGTVNNGMDLAFSLFATMAKQEMQQKKERFKRAKDYKKLEGKLPQGKPIKGYRLGKDRKIEIDEVQAELVKGVFNDYLNGDNESLNSIHEKYVAKGLFEPVLSKYRNAGKTRVWDMLKSPSYCGEPKTRRRKVTKMVNGVEITEYVETTITYPAIIEKEVYDAVQEKLKGRKAMPKKDHKHIYYAKGLIRCGVCGHSMKVISPDKTYCCKEVKGHTMNISVNVVDYIVWEIAKGWINYYTYDNWGKARKGYQEKLDEAKFNLDAVLSEVERLKDKKKKINNRYYSEANEGGKLMDEETFDGLIMAVNEDLKELEKKSLKYQNTITSYTSLISDIGISPLQNPYKLEALSDAERVEVIKKVIKAVKVERYENKASYKITVEPTDVIEPLAKGDNWVWEYQSKQRSVILHLSETVSEQRVFTRRFEPRKRERAKMRAANKAEQ